MGLPLRDMAERDRPRERLDRLGTSALTDAELLGLVLRSGGARTSALDLAGHLLAENGGLDGLSTARLEDLLAAPAMGSAKASSVVAAFELGRRADLGRTPASVTIRDAADVAAVACRELTDAGREAVLVLVLNAAHRLIKTQRLTTGTDIRCLLDSRDVLRAVVGAGGVAFAIAHNHPAGDHRPSAEDLASTKVLQAAAASLGVRLLDHVIVSGRGWRSVITR